MKETTQYRTPGQFIQELLESKGWTQRVLAIVLNKDETQIGKILTGKRPLDAETALALSQLFPDVTASFLLQLQKNYELEQARIVTRDDPDRNARAQIFGKLPVSDMIKRGWLQVEDMRNFTAVKTELLKFFKAESLEEIETISHAAKKTDFNNEITHSQLAWLYRVKEIAVEMLVARYSKSAAQAVIPKLKELLISPVAARKVSRIFAECGIRFVICESLPGAKIDGVCFWLDENSPVIGLSMRFDRIDNFWFVLRHELEHVICAHGRDAKKAMLDVELEGDSAGTGDRIAEEERIANQAAANFCVPQKSLESFIARKSPFFYERDIAAFATTIQVHPGLVAGQLRNRIKLWNRFTNHLVKIRSSVAPGATVDGWGDIVPVG